MSAKCFRWLTKPVVLKETAREHHAVWPGLCPSLSSVLPEPFKAIEIQGDSREFKRNRSSFQTRIQVQSRFNPSRIKVRSDFNPTSIQVKTPAIKVDQSKSKLVIFPDCSGIQSPRGVSERRIYPAGALRRFNTLPTEVGVPGHLSGPSARSHTHHEPPSLQLSQTETPKRKI